MRKIHSIQRNSFSKCTEKNECFPKPSKGSVSFISQWRSIIAEATPFFNVFIKLSNADNSILLFS